MDLILLTQQRLDFLKAYLNLIPEDLLGVAYHEFQADEGAVLTNLDNSKYSVDEGSILLDLDISEYPDWMKAWINLARWQIGILPGVRQLQNEDQKAQFKELQERFFKLLTLVSRDYEPAFKIFQRVLGAFDKNCWVFDMLREDQKVVVSQSRRILAQSAASYVPTFYQTKEEFKKVYPNLKSFLNNPTLMKDLNGVNLIDAPTGTGKCLGIDTPIIMVDGTIKKVQDVVVGDRVMGPDGKGRNVISLGRGSGPLYRVKPSKGDPYIVNDAHILSLLRMDNQPYRIGLADGRKIEKEKGPHFINVETYYKSCKSSKSLLLGWRPGPVSFENEETNHPIPPYILGVWLGDGSALEPDISKPEGPVVSEWIKYAESIGRKVSKVQYKDECPTWRILGDGGRNPFLKKLKELGVAGNKHIPKSYLITSIENRLELLAGLLDTDGYRDYKGFEITQKNEKIADSIVFLCRSLGLAAYLKKSFVKCQNFEGGWYNRIYISGECDKIPVRDPKKKCKARLQIKNPLVTGIKVDPVGFGDYYGFELDGDHQFLLGDWQVTHNTRQSLIASLNRFNWSNDISECTIASNKVLVFVRTRSQTQSFLKESNRLGLSVACPVSQALGCSAHATLNRSFLANMENLAYRIKASTSLKEIQIPTIVPIELYEYNLLQESPELSKFGSKLRHIVELGRESSSLKEFIAKAKKAVPNLLEFFQDENLKREMYDYLTATKSCSSCKASLNRVTQANNKFEIEQLEYFPGLESTLFDFDSVDKNADINFLAHLYQKEMGWCGRQESQAEMESKDVIILTYNWLTDVNISNQLLKKLRENDFPGIKDKDTLFLNRAVICDEAHTLFNYNYTFTYGFSDLIEDIVRLEKLKIIFSYPQFKLKSGILASNPYYAKRFNPLKITEKEFFENGVLIEDKKEKVVSLKEEWVYGSILETSSQLLKGVHSTLKSLYLIASKDPTLQLFFDGLIGGTYFPKGLYHCFDDPASSFKGDIHFLEGTERRTKCYTELSEVYHFIDSVCSFLEFEKKKREEEFYAISNPDSQPKDKFTKDYKKSWEDYPDKDKLPWRKFLGQVENIYLEPLKELLELLDRMRNFVLVGLEVLYGGSHGSDRILAIGSIEDDKNGQDLRPFDKIRPSGFEFPMELTPAFLENTFNKYRLSEILNPKKGNLFIDPCRYWAFNKKLSCSLKVNRPAIQWALRPYPYISFLTGTPPSPVIWKNKSGFANFGTSFYPPQPSPYTYEYVNDVSLTYANRSQDNYQRLANHIESRTQQGRTLVCYPSMKVLEDIKKLFPSLYQEKTLFEVKGGNLSLDDIQKYVEGNEGSVHVVMGGKFVEGIEFTDHSGSSLIKQVIIVGVPFNPPSEEVSQVERYYQKVFGWSQSDCRKAFWYGPVKEKVLQARGRSVRNLTDRAKIVFLDSRYATDYTLREMLSL